MTVIGPTSDCATCGRSYLRDLSHDGRRCESCGSDRRRISQRLRATRERNAMARAQHRDEPAAELARRAGITIARARMLQAAWQRDQLES